MNKKQKPPTLRVEDVRRRNLTRILRQKKLLQKDVAELLGVSETRVSHIRSGYRAFGEKTARKVEQKLKLVPLTLDEDSKVHTVERITDRELLAGVQQSVTAALSAIGRSEVERTERYERIVELAYVDAKERGAIDAARIGRIVRETIRE